MSELMSAERYQLEKELKISLLARGVDVVKLLFQAYVYETWNVLLLSDPTTLRNLREPALASLIAIGEEIGRQLTLRGQPDLIGPLFVTYAELLLRDSGDQPDTSIVSRINTLNSMGHDILPKFIEGWTPTRRFVAGAESGNAALISRFMKDIPRGPNSDKMGEMTIELMDAITEWYVVGKQIAVELYNSFGPSDVEQVTLQQEMYSHSYNTLLQTMHMMQIFLHGGDRKKLFEVRAADLKSFVGFGEFVAKYIVSVAIRQRIAAPAVTTAAGGKEAVAKTTKSKGKHNNDEDDDDDSTSSLSSSDGAGVEKYTQSALRARRVRRRTALVTAAVVSSRGKKKAVF